MPPRKRMRDTSSPKPESQVPKQQPCKGGAAPPERIGNGMKKSDVTTAMQCLSNKTGKQFLFIGTSPSWSSQGIKVTGWHVKERGKSGHIITHGDRLTKQDCVGQVIAYIKGHVDGKGG